MSTRIRYTDTAIAGVKTSVKSFNADEGMLLSVTLNTNNLTFTLVNGNGVPVHEGSDKTINGLKKTAKKALESFGVQFDVEVRNLDEDTSNVETTVQVMEGV